MSVQPYFRAQIRRQSLRLSHDTSGYNSRTTPEERHVQTVLAMREVLASLTPQQRKRLLSLANMELTDCQFRRDLRLALNS